MAAIDAPALLVRRLCALIDGLNPGARDRLVAQLERLISQVEVEEQPVSSDPLHEEPPRAYSRRRRRLIEPADSFELETFGDVSQQLFGSLKHSAAPLAKRSRAMVALKESSRQASPPQMERASNDDEELSEMNSFFSQLEAEEQLLVSKENETVPATAMSSNPSGVALSVLATAAWPKKKKASSS